VAFSEKVGEAYVEIGTRGSVLPELKKMDEEVRKQNLKLRTQKEYYQSGAGQIALREELRLTREITAIKTTAGGKGGGLAGFAQQTQGLGVAASAAFLGTTALAGQWQFEMFKRASADLAGVIGQTMLPYLKDLTSAIRATADWFLNLPAPIKKAIGATIVWTAGVLVIIPIYTRLAAAATQAYLALSRLGGGGVGGFGKSAAFIGGGALIGGMIGGEGGAVIGGLIGGLAMLNPVVAAVTVGITALAWVVEKMMTPAAKKAALEMANQTLPPWMKKYTEQENERNKLSSLGAGGNPLAGFKGLVEASREIQTQVLQQGSNPMEKTAANTDRANGLLEGILAALQMIRPGQQITFPGPGGSQTIMHPDRGTGKPTYTRVEPWARPGG
jgi:hypothetical protein